MASISFLTVRGTDVNSWISSSGLSAVFKLGFDKFSVSAEAVSKKFDGLLLSSNKQLTRQLHSIFSKSEPFSSLVNSYTPRFSIIASSRSISNFNFLEPKIFDNGFPTRSLSLNPLNSSNP